MRCTLRPSRLSTFVLRCWAVATAVALIAEGAPMPAASRSPSPSLSHFAYIANQTIEFGQVMHRIIDQVARDGRAAAAHGRDGRPDR